MKQKNNQDGSTFTINADVHTIKLRLFSPNLDTALLQIYEDQQIKLSCSSYIKLEDKQR